MGHYAPLFNPARAALSCSKSGVLTLAEFCAFFGLTQTKFTDRVFGVSDEDESGELSFKGTQQQLSKVLSWAACVSSPNFSVLP